MKTFTLNFFENQNRIQVASLLADYFQVDFDRVVGELFAYIRQDYDVLQFIKLFNLDLSKSYYDCLKITCRHATTIHDDFKLLKDRGLQNLQIMLEQSTPLSTFLLRNNIIISVADKTIEFNGITYPILHRSECCESCVFENPKCENLFRRGELDYKDCEYREALSFLENKLYYDKCEIEVFIDATIDDIYSYTSVRYAPEILMTIQKVINYYTKKPISLENRWRKLPNSIYCILEFEIDLFDLEYKCSKVMYESFNEIDGVLTYHGYTEYDYANDRVDKAFYKNLYVLRKLIDKFIWEYSSDQYGQIVSSTKINWNDIRIIRQHGINELVTEDN